MQMSAPYRQTFGSPRGHKLSIVGDDIYGNIRVNAGRRLASLVERPIGDVTQCRIPNEEIVERAGVPSRQAV